MRKIDIPTDAGSLPGLIYDLNEIDWDRILYGPKSRKGKIKYFDTPCAFDIETTNITDADRPFAYMYHWQVCLGEMVLFGRTWSEFRMFLSEAERRLNLSEHNRLVIYVHNLAFEFQFMHRFLRITDVFARAERHPMKCLVNGCIEFRCSSILSNMSLEKFCENSRDVKYQKMSGAAYDYSKRRTAITPMTELEEAYCYCDVRGLCECIADRLRDDTMGSMPLTSTGYVRREYLHEVAHNPKNREVFLASRLTVPTYQMCRRGFRGGDVHANLLWVNQLLHGVGSYDEQSAYPVCMMVDPFPMGAFFAVSPYDLSRPEFGTEYAYMVNLHLTNVRYTGTCGIPYIPVAKCHIEGRRVSDNGRILYAESVYMTVTDIDYNIIIREYSYDRMEKGGAYASKYGYLPNEFRSVLMDLYAQKTALKGIDEKAYEYTKAKNRLNASYGMMVTRIDMPTVEYVNGEYSVTAVNLAEALDRYYKSRNSFLSYQHGVWVTAHARRRLREMLWTVGPDVVYCDTDSIKFKGDHRAEFEAKNAEVIAAAEKVGAWAYDKNGNKQYMGLWDYEGVADEFKTLGAKKYIYRKGDHIISTIAGVNKKVGARFFAEHGFDAFAVGQVIPDSGHLVAYYDDSDIHDICIDGCHMLTGSSVALVDDTYTIGVTGEYADLIEKALQNKLDV